MADVKKMTLGEIEFSTLDIRYFVSFNTRITYMCVERIFITCASGLI